MKTKIFERYLQEVFMSDYHGDKEHYEDAFDNWLSNLDVQEVIDYANVWSSICVSQVEQNEIKEMDRMQEYFTNVVQTMLQHPLFWGAISNKVHGGITFPNPSATLGKATE